MYRFRVNKKNITPNTKKKQKFSEMSEHIIRISDIVLEVLDARFIKETRNKDAEELVKKYKKKLIFVINKSDLLSKKNLKEKFSEDLRPYAFVSCKNKKGISLLRNIIKMEVSRLDDRYKIKHVGIIGYPNTGKSTLINILIGRSSAPTSAEAGFTRGIQKIKLAKNLLLIDTPGIIPQKEYDIERILETGKHSIIGARTNSQIKDPESEAYNIFEKYGRFLEKFYGIEEKEFDQFIEKLGRKRHSLIKGNITDEERVYRMIIRDWQQGRIRID